MTTFRFLGTGGYHPNDRRETTGLLFPELGLLFDCGTCAYRLQEYVETDELTIILTHAHWDHIIGLTYLLVPMFKQEWKKVRLIAHQPTLEAVKSLLFAEPTFPVWPGFEMQTLHPNEELEFGTYTVKTMPLVSHPGESTGLRLNTPDGSLAFITDTWCDGSYSEFIQGADLLIHECHFDDDNAELAKQTGHSHTTPVAKLAKECGIERLILTHIDPQNCSDEPVNLSQAQQFVPLTSIAEDLMVGQF